MALILASGSPRRRELMSLITPDYTVITSDVDETKIAADSRRTLPRLWPLPRPAPVAEGNPDDVVCGFDTVVECEGEVFGKPKDEADAVRMLRALSGREHRVHTGVCICRGPPCRRHCRDNRCPFLARSRRTTCAPTCARRSPTTRREPMPSRDTRRCGVRASKGATTTSWGCRFTARRSCCASLPDPDSPGNGSLYGKNLQHFLHAFSGEYTLCLPKTSALIWAPPTPLCT